MTNLTRTATASTDYATLTFTATAGLSVFRRHNLTMLTGQLWEFTAAEATALLAAFPNNFAPTQSETPDPPGSGYTPDPGN